ncbi:Hsp20/alpha crystallin family protein [Chengkuizengella axinellae]|uniref:Hsp20/alpha crystallin family protein n=1 Tax=Chengkuizengella axinellae TaxID=3064388 RepID=A0ABT9IT54_9BACL|nr:Hsp20/alpha crystallin family protein [Chengkuizengella sp. 2205SS18-9]MDP5272503.1 Hsp20/alpha crystallin family protein [Chengkuizengella sp. 2205SS18-9]
MNNLFDQRQFNKLIKDQLANTSSSDIDPTNLDLSWIDKYVSETLDKAFSRTGTINTREAPSSTEQLKTDLLDIHHYLIAKIHIPKHIDHKKIKLSINATKLKIRGLPEGDSQMVDLPTQIDTHDTKAIYKDHILEVRMPKLPDNDDNYNHVKVHFDE